MASGHGIPHDEAAAISIALEGILYGISLLMFFGTIWAALTYKQRLRDVNRSITFLAILLLMLSTAHMTVDIIRIELGFVKYRDTFPGGPAAYLSDITQPLYVVKNSIFTSQTLVGDAVLIYRCYVVWQSIWVIIVPTMFWCCGVVTGILALYSASQATSNVTNVHATTTSFWVTVFFTSTLVTNLLGSGLLAYRIWTLEYNASMLRATRSSAVYILRVVMDAAILYSVTLFIALVCFAISNNGEIVMLYMLPPIISIAFYMVLIRVAIRHQSCSYLSTIGGGSIAESGRGDWRMKPLQVPVSKFKQDDASSSYGVPDQQDVQPSRKANSVESAHCGV